MSKRFQDQLVLITGAARGIGRAIAERFLAEGAFVAIADLDGAAVQTAAHELDEGHAGRALPLPCDVTKSQDVEQCVQRTIKWRGPPRVLVNNAGLCTFGRLEELTERDWDAVLDVNAKGVFLCCRAVLPHMREAGGGSIVSVASQAGLKGETLISHYCAAKAAVVNLTRAIALEAAPIVRANSVCPGVVQTGMIRGELAWRAAELGDDPETTEAEWRTHIPLGRFQDPSHVAHAVLFLASEDASEITGQALSVDGGTVMR